MQSHLSYPFEYVTPITSSYWLTGKWTYLTKPQKKNWNIVKHYFYAPYCKQIRSNIRNILCKLFRSFLGAHARPGMSARQSVSKLVRRSNKSEIFGRVTHVWGQCIIRVQKRSCSNGEPGLCFCFFSRFSILTFLTFPPQIKFREITLQKEKEKEANPV